MKNKNFEVKYLNNTGCFNELEYIEIDGKLYYEISLSSDAVALLTAMSYYRYECTLAYFDNLAQILTYEVVLQGLLELSELGARISTAEIYRGLVMNSYKNKYKGMMRV